MAVRARSGCSVSFTGFRYAGVRGGKADRAGVGIPFLSPTSSRG